MLVYGNTPKTIRFAEKFASSFLPMLLLCISVLATGAFFSFIGYCTGFQRSGAVLVCVAILGVYLNYFVMREEKTAVAHKDIITSALKGLRSIERVNRDLEFGLDIDNSDQTQSATDRKQNIIDHLPKL